MGIASYKNFRSEPRTIKPAEVNSIYQFCKTFEQKFGDEIQYMLEYKIQMVDRTTYFLDESEQKSYEVELAVMAEERIQKRLRGLSNKISQLEKLTSIKIDVKWNIVKDV